jgi:RNA polymerase sigma-B factor
VSVGLAEPPTAGPAAAALRARNEMIERNLPLARRLAGRYARSADSAEELFQVASLALVKAVDRFDPSRGNSFKSYAIPTILGDIKRHLRDTRWALHVPRDLQEQAQAVVRERDRLTTELGRPPTIREVGESLGMDVEEAIAASAAMTGLDTVSLDAPAEVDGEPGATLHDSFGVLEHGYELAEDIEAIMPAMTQLPRRERLVLRLRFLDDMTQSEIGERLGVSQMHVSRLLRRALDDVRRLTTGAPPDRPCHWEDRRRGRPRLAVRTTDS